MWGFSVCPVSPRDLWETGSGTRLRHQHPGHSDPSISPLYLRFHILRHGRLTVCLLIKSCICMDPHSSVQFIPVLFKGQLRGQLFWHLVKGLSVIPWQPVVRTSTAENTVQSLVSKLGSHMLCGVAKKSDLKIYKEKNWQTSRTEIQAISKGININLAPWT